MSVSKLEALSPLKLLSSGYCVAVNSANSVISHLDQVKNGDKISIIVSDGKIECDVTRVFLGGGVDGEEQIV